MLALLLTNTVVIFAACLASLHIGMRAGKKIKSTDKPRAFLTGSRRYGTPREDSDYDVVALVDPKAFHVLSAKFKHTDRSPGNLKIGDLNLIMVRTDEEFDMWKETTERLERMGPVTHDEAVNEFRKSRRLLNTY